MKFNACHDIYKRSFVCAIGAQRLYHAKTWSSMSHNPNTNRQESQNWCSIIYELSINSRIIHFKVWSIRIMSDSIVTKIRFFPQLSFKHVLNPYISSWKINRFGFKTSDKPIGTCAVYTNG